MDCTELPVSAGARRSLIRIDRGDARFRWAIGSKQTLKSCPTNSGVFGIHRDLPRVTEQVSSSPGSDAQFPHLLDDKLSWDAKSSLGTMFYPSIQTYLLDQHHV